MDLYISTYLMGCMGIRMTTEALKYGTMLLSEGTVPTRRSTYSKFFRYTIESVDNDEMVMTGVSTRE